MASKELKEALVEQMNFEMESGYLYLGMAAYFAAEDLEGFEHWLTKQAEEEYDHARRFIDFIQDIDGEIKYTGMPEVPSEYDSFLEVFEKALEHEKEVTRRIYKLKEMAEEEKCYDTLQFLEWFIEEQREEENNFKPIVTRLERIKNHWQGLYALNAQMARREE